jgi:hypothetical protein
MVFAGLATPHFVRIVHSEGQMASFFVILHAKLNFFVGNIEKQFLVDLGFIKKKQFLIYLVMGRGSSIDRATYYGLVSPGIQSG